jgi:hypothetical protein
MPIVKNAVAKKIRGARSLTLKMGSKPRTMTAPRAAWPLDGRRRVPMGQGPGTDGLTTPVSKGYTLPAYWPNAVPFAS